MNEPVPREVLIFNEALQLPVSRRTNYLNESCGEDAGLRSRVTELLEAHDSAGTFLEDLPDARSVTAAAASLRQDKPTPTSRTKISVHGTSEFGDYELLEEIGRGGQGVVYRARQKSLNRTVALKIIGLGHWASASHLKRFRRDAEAAASLEHPQIVPIYEIGERDGSCYFSMKFVEGGRLDQAINREPMSLVSAAELLVKIARTVHFAHEHRILHRDIKPGNILLDRNGEPHLTDFGLARLIEQESTVTNSFDILGTPSYMSPEQAAGHTKELTAATDVYSLGAVFYQMLTGEPPFAGGTTYETIRLVLETDPRNPRVRNPKVDLDLATICLKCLEKDPLRRYPTALALADDVERWLRREPIQARRTGPLMRGKKWLQRNPATAVAIASLAALTITFGLVIWKTDLIQPLSPTKGIAVLPFTNLSENKEDEFFADGVQDDILTKLAKISELKVISRTSVMAYRGAHNIKEIARTLNVSHILEGSLRKDVGRLHLNTNLIDARTDRHVWAEEYDRYLNDVFAVQSDVAAKVAEQLHAKILPDEKRSIDRAPTTDLAAFDLFNRAKSILLSIALSAGNEQILRQVVELLDQAVQRDPTFFDAYYYLAYAHEELYLNGYDHTEARVELAEAALQTMARLRPDVAEMHLARANYLYRIHHDYEGALAELEKARQSLPNDPRPFELTGRILRRRGQPDENLVNFERALELDPRNKTTLQQAAISYLAVRRYPEAAAMLDRAVNIVPTDVVTKGARAWVDLDWKADVQPLHEMIESILSDPAAISDAADNWFCCALVEHDYAGAARALAALGDNPWWGDDAIVFDRNFGEGLLARLLKDEPRAIAAFTKARIEQQKIVQAQPDQGPPLCLLSLIDAALGNRDAALEEGERAINLLPVEKDFIDGNHMIQYFAITAAWAGDNDRALQQLETSIAARAPSQVLSYGALKLLPFWDPLRGDPRFKKVVDSLAPK
jgi:serine/threonine protein kinase/tetratricopeptide (TPR) repeat protein